MLLDIGQWHLICLLMAFFFTHFDCYHIDGKKMFGIIADARTFIITAKAKNFVVAWQLQKVDKIETENRKYTIVVLYGTDNIQYCQLLNEFLLHTVTKIRKTNVHIVKAWYLILYFDFENHFLFFIRHIRLCLC